LWWRSIQAYFTLHPSRSTPSLFLRCRAPFLHAQALLSGVPIPFVPGSPACCRHPSIRPSPPPLSSCPVSAWGCQINANCRNLHFGCPFLCLVVINPPLLWHLDAVLESGRPFHYKTIYTLYIMRARVALPNRI